ncbi:hypothetical protein TRIATDRAFT_83455 [Trichoderma atroviride IMI 206040]|uniref:RNase III domain-containing protein n=1 Tax=Hypocrea atroviridis (strain ATCC 20476 / IMI 206040) TaxID=452589 RepID=G9NF66_HYPAI|nr:uncharacterized protein TRIATDRAFT_83455 [Trichoderma atroviride IMI 206040]EHK50582.1 hypothetical protein TRIATDRAFT_83455 [Trichoderma atroviride IMI 206040]
MVATDIQSILQYHFKDPALLKEALHAGSSTSSTSRQGGREHENKALAMIGDAVLRLVVVDDGIVGGKTRQSCHQIWVAETSNPALSTIFVKWKIIRFVRLPPEHTTIVSQTTAASTIEALVGAVWIDSDRDFDTVHRGNS